MPYDIEYLLLSVFGKLINQDKTSENPVKSILLSNSPFSQKDVFGKKNPQKYVFGRFNLFLGTFLGSVTLFWGNSILGIDKYQEVLLCVRKVTREGVKRRI